MLTINVIMHTEFNDDTQEFVEEVFELKLEHSLASLSKWEMIWEIPLLSSNDKTEEQNRSYLECMCLDPDVPPEVLDRLTKENQEAIANYLEKKNTATWFSNNGPTPRSGETLTAELIYYWMSGFQIDWEAQYWNLNRLMTLIKVFSLKADNKPNKQGQKNRQEEIARINAQRRKELGSNG